MSLETEVKAAIRRYSDHIIGLAARGELTEEQASSDIAHVIDMAVRRDPDFMDALTLPDAE